MPIKPLHDATALRTSHCGRGARRHREGSHGRWADACAGWGRAVAAVAAPGAKPPSSLSRHAQKPAEGESARAHLPIELGVEVLLVQHLQLLQDGGLARLARTQQQDLHNPHLHPEPRAA
eukprot:3777002-Prymnesium_polylepis.4